MGFLSFLIGFKIFFGGKERQFRVPEVGIYIYSFVLIFLQICLFSFWIVFFGPQKGLKGGERQIWVPEVGFVSI